MIKDEKENKEIISSNTDKIKLSDRAVFIKQNLKLSSFLNKRTDIRTEKDNQETIDWKNIKYLQQKCLTERGKILPTRVTNKGKKTQKQIQKAVKIARFLGLLK